MKYLFATIIATSSLFVSQAASAKVECLFKDSNTVSTPNRHCAKNCKRHADVQPIETLTLKMSEKWKKKGAFYKNPSARCAGGNGCGYVNISGARTLNNGQTASVTYKTWSIPVKIVIEADICIVD